MPLAKNSGAYCSTEELEPRTPVHLVVALHVVEELARKLELEPQLRYSFLNEAKASGNRVDVPSINTIV